MIDGLPTVEIGTLTIHDIDSRTTDGIIEQWLTSPEQGRAVCTPNVDYVVRYNGLENREALYEAVLATEQWAASGELRKRLLAAFAANGIEIPRPQRVVLARDPQLDPFQPGGTSSPPPPPEPGADPD